MKLLIIEDEPGLLESITDYFGQEDYLCETAADFEQGMEKISLYQYDCVILDINLPGGNGLKLLAHLRKQQKQEGVVIISARNSLDDKIEGLNLGADDYVVKPFHLSELNARVKALIRRKYAQGNNELTIGNLRLNLAARKATCADQPLMLTKNEYDLLLFLVSNKNRVISKQAIAEHLYGDQSDNIPSFDFVYSHIKNLKKKLKDKQCHDLIQTVYGLGYKLEEEL